MKLTDIQVDTGAGPLVLAQPEEVDALEAGLWITLPAGYREYVTQLGEGVLGGTWARVYPPWRIRREVTPWRARIARHWRWGKGSDRLPMARALECVPLADTVGGDELVFHPRYPDRLFVLPRHHDDVFVAGADLLAAVEWMCGSGTLVRRFAERVFEPFDSRTEEARGSEDPPGESLGDIVELGRAWARRHRAREARFDALPAGNGKVSFVYEAIVLESVGVEIETEAPGYLAVFRVDRPDGQVRIYHAQVDGDGVAGTRDGDLAKRPPPESEYLR